MADPPTPSFHSVHWRWGGAVVIGLLAVAVFGYRLSSEPEFPDEWAYVSQAYYLDLLAQPDHVLWLEYPAYDLPPLPKYTVGLALELGGYRRPHPAAAQRWYEDIKARFGPHEMLVAARWPSVILGALGCVCVHALGTMVVDRRVGFLAALLLMLDPLYRMQARRAMSDIQEEALLLAALALGLWGWSRLLSGRGRRWVGMVAYLGAGVLSGLAVLAKLNGGLALMILGTWAVLAVVVTGFPWRGKVMIVVTTSLAGLVAYAVFVPLNPFLWADPEVPVPTRVRATAREGILQRTARLIDHRRTVSDLARRPFPHNALDSPSEKLGAVVVQGFGRFGPLGRKRIVEDIYEPSRRVAGFDSTIRYDWRQDRGALVWFPLVVAGMVCAAWKGRGQIRGGLPPTAWALLAMALLSFATVTTFIPLAWDRYFLPIQAPACLLGASAVVLIFDRLMVIARGAGLRELRTDA